jgi:hypothetical protein
MAGTEDRPTKHSDLVLEHVCKAGALPNKVFPSESLGTRKWLCDFAFTGNRKLQTGTSLYSACRMTWRISGDSEVKWMSTCEAPSAPGATAVTLP